MRKTPSPTANQGVRISKPSCKIEFKGKRFFAISASVSSAIIGFARAAFQLLSQLVNGR
jgi:hypothetical protein